MVRNKWYLLPPENYNKVFDVLSQRYPKFFVRGKVFIFKKGIHRDIFNDEELKFSKTIIRKFLKLYAEQKEYIKLHVESAVRYDLEGNEAGIVTKEDVQSLAKTQEEIRNQIALKKSKKLEQKKHYKPNEESKPSNQNNKLELVDVNAVNVNGDKPKLGINFKVENKNE
jgi:sRNA-binding protein